jgi:hypothetical protein
MKLSRKPTLPLGPTSPRRTGATKDAPGRHANAQARSHILRPRPAGHGSPRDQRHRPARAGGMPPEWLSSLVDAIESGIVKVPRKQLA